jgi:GNAT superfamily N-acetyltransferase
MDDPVAIWMCRAADLRARLLEAMYTGRLQQLLARGTVWMNPARTSVAVWTAPAQPQPSVHLSAELLRCLLNPRMAVRAPLLARGLATMRSRHPRRPEHWYLSLLGTDPDAQGRGLGSAVLAPALERCDADGVGAYLESSKPRNLDFYARFGFKVMGELRLPMGPTMWQMWREPRIGGA